MSRVGGKPGREQLLKLLTGDMSDRTLRGEIWPLPAGGDADEIVAAAKELQADFCFFDHLPGSGGKARALGLAAGAVVNGPWQRWLNEVGWQEAMLQLARDSELLQQGLAAAAQGARQEIAAWQATGIELVLLADAIYVASTAGAILVAALPATRGVRCGSWTFRRFSQRWLRRFIVALFAASRFLVLFVGTGRDRSAARLGYSWQKVAFVFRTAGELADAGRLLSQSGRRDFARVAFGRTAGSEFCLWSVSCRGGGGFARNLSLA
jgi:hypothetical protein